MDATDTDQARRLECLAIAARAVEGAVAGTKPTADEIVAAAQKLWAFVTGDQSGRPQ